jgi:hypothetical protein
MRFNTLLFFLFIAAPIISVHATDSVFMPSKFPAISLSQYQLYRAQLSTIDSAAFYPQSLNDAALVIPQNLQPFIGPAEIREVYNEVFEKKSTTYTKRKTAPGHHYAFWKGNKLYNTGRFTGHEEWGLLRNENASIWRKVGRGSLLIGGAELVGMGILMLLPKEITKWQDDWVQDAGRNMKRAFTTAPVMDKDDWQMNYLGHPIAGALYYNTIRSQNASWFHSFLFSTAQSFIWEYIIEGVAEQPSIQDIFITPIAGSLLGEACHKATMGMRKNGFNFVEKVATLVLNPMFVINNGFGPKHNPPFYKN